MPPYDIDRQDERSLMNILVTLNANYITPLKGMLWSLFLTILSSVSISILMHSSIPLEVLDNLHGYIEARGQSISIIAVQGDWFTDAPIVMHYTKEMYYQPLAYKFLPTEMERILYLDPDILVIGQSSSSG